MPLKFWTFVAIYFALLSCNHSGNKSSVKSDSSKRYISPTQKESKVKSISPFYDNDVSTLGIGVVIAPDKFVVYNDSLLNNKFSSINMYGDEKAIGIYSKFYKPDYGIMHFICLQATDKCYKVVVNYNTIKYLPKSKGYEFATWTDYIMQSFGIRRNKDNAKSHQPLRVSPTATADTLSISGKYEMFCPVEVKGDWVKAKFDCFYNDDNSKHEGEPCQNYISECKDPVTGWIKWRDGNKVLIDILLMP